MPSLCAQGQACLNLSVWPVKFQAESYKRVTRTAEGTGGQNRTNNLPLPSHVESVAVLWHCATNRLQSVCVQSSAGGTRHRQLQSADSSVLPTVSRTTHCNAQNARSTDLLWHCLNQQTAQLSVASDVKWRTVNGAARANRGLATSSDKKKN
jgi:hypothetical protein